VRYTALDAMPEAQALRREIERQERRGDPPTFNEFDGDWRGQRVR